MVGTCRTVCETITARLPTKKCGRFGYCRRKRLSGAEHAKGPRNIAAATCFEGAAKCRCIDTGNNTVRLGMGMSSSTFCCATEWQRSDVSSGGERLHHNKIEAEIDEVIISSTTALCSTCVMSDRYFNAPDDVGKPTCPHPTCWNACSKLALTIVWQTRSRTDANMVMW
jgi:hypothetical protein